MNDILDKYEGKPGKDGKRPKGKGQLGKLQEEANKLKAQGEQATAKSHHIHAAVNWIDYGHLALDFLGYSGNVGLMSPTNNTISHLVFSLFSADWFISLATLTNVAILLVMGAKAWRSVRESAGPPLQPALSST